MSYIPITIVFFLLYSALVHTVYSKRGVHKFWRTLNLIRAYIANEEG